MTMQKRGRGRPMGKHRAIPISVRIPERIYDLYCLEAILTMDKVASILRRAIVRHANVNFRSRNHLRRRHSAQTEPRGVYRS